MSLAVSRGCCLIATTACDFGLVGLSRVVSRGSLLATTCDLGLSLLGLSRVLSRDSWLVTMCDLGLSLLGLPVGVVCAFVVFWCALDRYRPRDVVERCAGSVVHDGVLAIV